MNTPQYTIMVVDDEENIRWLYKEELEEEIKMLLIPKDPEDEKDVIFEIRSGTGGDEASIFAGDLYRMYAKFCEKKGWRMEISNVNEGTSGGFKEIVASVKQTATRQLIEFSNGKLLLMGIKVRANAEILNKTFEELSQENQHLLVVAIQRENKTIIPKGTELEFHVHNKKINFIWKKEKYILSLSFINLLNNYLKKPLPIK